MPAMKLLASAWFTVWVYVVAGTVTVVVEMICVVVTVVEHEVNITAPIKRIPPKTKNFLFILSCQVSE